MSPNITPAAVEAAARAIAKADDADYWVEDVDNWNALDESEKFDEEYPSMAFEDRDRHRNLARAALVAAEPILTTPRTITTHKELDALPADSVVLDGQGLALVYGGDGQWHVGINGDIWHAPAVMYHGPATVLHTPEETQ